MGLIALIASLLGFFYTAKPIRLSGRKGLGELTIYLCFGPLLTVGSAIAMSTNTIILDFQNLRDFIFIVHLFAKHTIYHNKYTNIL